jgi:hypothetical protein
MERERRHLLAVSSNTNNDIDTYPDQRYKRVIRANTYDRTRTLTSIEECGIEPSLPDTDLTY